MSSCQTGATTSSSLHHAAEDDISDLLAMLRQVKDPRDSRGKIYPLGYVLAVVVVATCARAMNDVEIAEGGLNRSVHRPHRAGEPTGFRRGVNVRMMH
jgi:hypothetical protein